MRALLDVNFVIALLDPDHMFNKRAHVWWANNSGRGWASCPITENGIVRIMSNPNYSRQMKFPPPEIISRIREFARKTDHEFWPDDVSFCDGKTFLTSRILGSRLLTDLYLVGLAVKHGGRLVTFDQGIQRSFVADATANHLVAV